MRVRNVHVRRFAASPETVGRLIDTLASADDRLWPHDRWPAMRFDRPLAVGAVGGHGPIRYTVDAYLPGRVARFHFTAPRGVVGTHRFEVWPTESGCDLAHVMEIDAVGAARFTWPLVFRPLHDALLEDLLDRAARSLGEPPADVPWPPRVRALRWLLARVRRRTRRRGASPAPRPTPVSR